MDGPRLNVASPWAKRERGLYEAIEPVDHIFVLSATEEMSVERKPELREPPRRDALKRKIEAVDRLVASPTEGISVIDTSQGRDACLLEIKRVLWGLL